MGFVDDANGTGSLNLRTAGTNALTIDNSQNVGINEDTPTTKLDVRLDSTSTDLTADYAMFINNQTGAVSDRHATIGFGTYNNGGLTNVFGAVAEGTGAQSGFAFLTHNGGALTEKVRISNDGDVGIGTSPTDVKGLHIKSDEDSDFVMLKLEADSTTRDASMSFITSGGNTFSMGIDASDSDKFKISDNATLGTNDKLVIDSSGNVGITDSSPSTALTSFGSASRGLSIKNVQPTIALTDTDATGAFWIANVGGQSYLQNNVSGSIYRFLTSDGEKLRILNGGGITFNGDTAAANALDDYEEGTITPTLLGSSSNPTQVYAARGGHYTKIGNRVFYTIRILMNSSGVSAGSGNLTIAGLPFTVKDDVNNHGAVVVGVSSNFLTGQHGSPTSGFHSAANTVVGLVVYDNDSGNIGQTFDADAADVQNNTSLTISGHYIV